VAVGALGLVLLGAAAGHAADTERAAASPRLPARVKRIVLHVPGGPSYTRPELRFVFLDPLRTQALWRRSFGTHWIVWTDGSLWPRHPEPGQPPSRLPVLDRPADLETRRRLAREARPVYAHLHNGNTASLGIEVAHSGRRGEAFPPAQVRSLAWLLRTLLEMSDGRLGTAAIFGHKDLDARPAYVFLRCQQPGCPVYADDAGRPYRRRVDPPEALFTLLEAEGLRIPRPSADGDAELARTESLPAGRRPQVSPGS
jgi:hypothetical protein